MPKVDNPSELFADRSPGQTVAAAGSIWMATLAPRETSSADVVRHLNAQQRCHTGLVNFGLDACFSNEGGAPCPRMRYLRAMATRSCERSLAEHQDVFQNLGQLADAIDDAISLAADSLRSGGKILLCGNGGSAADSQHIAAELVGRFMAERRPLPALALTTDTSILTAVANDYAYDQVFVRQVRACGRPGDCLIGYSTSGNSENVIEAFRVAKSLGMTTIGLIGRDGGRLKGLGNVEIIVPSNTTSRIQEAHAFIGHALCEGIEIALGLADA